MNNEIKEHIKILLCNAIEGGSFYWCRIEKHNKNDFPECKFLCDLLTFPNSYMVFNSAELDSPKTITHDDILKTWEIFSTNKKYLRHYSNLINNHDDAETGDVFLQLAVFGDVILS